MTLPDVASQLLMAAESAATAARPVVGRIQGGWGYVWASYGITWGVLAAYGLSLWLRRPRATSTKETP